jgi:Ser/Thr protein kinase RdoA (MazF antagonist)
MTLYQDRLNLNNATFTLIEHEDAMVATVYEVKLFDGDRLILKICSRAKDYFREVYCLKYFADKLSVPKIIQVVAPEKDLKGAILMEYIPGTLLKIAELTNELTYEIGSALAKIHLNRAAGYGELMQPDRLTSDPRIYFTQKFEENFAECASNLPQELLIKCREYFKTHIDLLSKVDGPCIIHRDFRPGNLIIDNGKLNGIIDWSSACAGFAQEDFCTNEHEAWLNPMHKKIFLDGYASIRPVPEYRSIMPLVRLNKALATIGFTVKRETWQSIGAHLYQFNRKFLETFLSSV